MFRKSRYSSIAEIEVSSARRCGVQKNILHIEAPARQPWADRHGGRAIDSECLTSRRSQASGVAGTRYNSAQ